MLEIRKDWKKILRKAWSVRLMLLAGILSGAEVALPMVQHKINLPVGTLAAGSALLTLAALVARHLSQKDFKED